MSHESQRAVIRRANASDASLLADLGARTFDETFAAGNNPDDMAAYLASAFTIERLGEELADPVATFFIAEVGATAAGYAKVRAGAPAERRDLDGPVELVRLYVGREWLGRGVGADLMAACLKEAVRGAYRTIWLGVWEHNARARAFYRRWHFEEIGHHTFHLGADAQRDILMARAVVK